MAPFVITVDDPRRDDIRELLARHLAFAHEHTPPADVHALDLSGLLDEAVTFCSARQDGELLGIGALKQLDPTHGELKSMHTAAAARRRGIGRAMVDHLVAVARQRGYGRVSLETGTMEAFGPARSLYEASGFTACGPFDGYSPSASSAFMTRALDD
jgi:putative acetyltransferase